MSKIRRRLLGTFLLTLFIGYLSCVTLFMHIHYVDGAVVVHTHPMDHHKGHSHSSGDYLSLAEFTSYSVILFDIDFIPFLDQLTHYIAVDSTPDHIEYIDLSSHSPRDPPIRFI